MKRGWEWPFRSSLKVRLRLKTLDKLYQLKKMISSIYGNILKIHAVEINLLSTSSETPLATLVFCERCFSPQQKACEFAFAFEPDEKLFSLTFLLSFACFDC